jgi:hypothetical protein
MKMVFLLGLALAWFIGSLASAADIPRSLTGGTVVVKLQAVEGPDSVGTKSLSSRVVATGLQVFCQNILFPTDIAEGPTTLIPKTDVVVRLEGIAWSGDDCTGVASVASVDQYTVTFGPPLAPVLMP